MDILKKIGIIFGAIVGTVYLLFLVLPLIASPILNGYIPTINQEITKNLGLTNEIKNIKLVTTPKLTIGIKIGNFILKTPKNEEILNSENFQAKMSLLPLLTRNVEADIIQAEKINVTLNLNKDGSFEIEKYLPKTEETSETTEETTSAELPFGLKLSNHLPNIKIGAHNICFKDLSTGAKYQLTGDKLEITDFILNKKVHLKTNGKIVLKDRTQFVYDLNIDNRIMPEVELNELVFNPQPEEQKETPQPVNILNIFNELYNKQVTANITTDLYTDKKEHLNFKGFAKIDNISISPSGLKLPASDINAKFNGHKISINSNLYSAENEKSTLNGTFTTGKTLKTDFQLKSGADLSNIVKIVNAVALVFDIKDLQTLTANGKIDADLKVKTNDKKIVTGGYLKIPTAKIHYGLYNTDINDINANITLDNNTLNIVNLSFAILGQPLKIYGTVKQDTTADIHVVGNNLGLKGLLIACGQAALLKDNQINSGLLSLNAEIKGKLAEITPIANISLNNISIKNIPANTIINMPKTDVKIIADKKGFSGNLISTGSKIMSSGINISIPNLKANINNDYIELLQTPITADRINLTLAGKIKNYMTEKMVLDFVTTGDVKSTLSGSVNMAKQTLNLVFASPNNNTIIIPFFPKSKMTFNGNTTISGNMMNPVLSGAINIPSLNMPEIPVTMKETAVKLNGTILHGKATVKEFASGGIVATNASTDFALKGNDFYLNNVKATAFDGTVYGNIIYNLANAKTTVKFSGANLDAKKTVQGTTGIKDALTGSLSFDTAMTMTVADYNDMMRSLKGNLSFKVSNGSFGQIGRLENMLNAGNILSNAVLKNTVSALTNIAGIKDTAKYDYINGSMTFSNGWANITSIKSTGSKLAYYVTGKYNLINGTTNAVILGRLDGTVVALLGPLGDMSVSKLVAYIPKFGSMTSAIVDKMTTNPKNENIAAIPALSNGNKNYKDFKVVFNGGIESRSSVKSFQWLTNVDTSEIDKISVSDTLKSIQSSLNTDKQNAVNQAQSVVNSVKNQQEMIKNSAEELKNLFKF